MQTSSSTWRRHGRRGCSRARHRAGTGATSNIIAMYLLNGLMVNVVTRLAETGMSPLPVFVSANVDGGDEHNARVLSHYRGRLGYL